jgi:uncharacterized protein
MAAKKNTTFVGRAFEIARLSALQKSNKAELIVIYGRRRVGKTFLIKEYYNYTFDFYVTAKGSEFTQDQLIVFNDALIAHGATKCNTEPSNWKIAFDRLKLLLKKKKAKKNINVFIDELPWFDTKGSNFVVEFEHFWNSWASEQKNLTFIVCGSATSWIINEIINNTKGLHNRVTQQIKVLPFTLSETEQFLQTKKINFSINQLLEIYMVIGGIPFYLDALLPNLSATQNIEYLFFKENSPLRNEFKNLYKAVFKKHEAYENLVAILATKNYGITRQEIIDISSKASGGTLTNILSDLESCGFIKSYPSFDEKPKNTIYRLSDYFTQFYFKFMTQKKMYQKNGWINMLDNPTHRVWQGLQFEQVCIDHIQAIQFKLGIEGIFSTIGAWRGSIDKNKVQIDLLINRRDDVINICEVKFSMSEYIITKDYAQKLRNKIGLFKQITNTKKSVHLNLICSNGIKQNQYSQELTNRNITGADLLQLQAFMQDY